MQAKILLQAGYGEAVGKSMLNLKEEEE